MTPFVTKRLSGWGGVPAHECRVFRPERTRELAAVLRDGAGAGGSYVSRGLGRSYGDAAVNPCGVILHTRLDHFINFDPATGVLECEAGVSLADVLRVFVPRGWFLPVTPGTKFVTVGGAIAVNVHGKNHHRDGTFGQFVEEIRLMTAGGEVLRCGPAENADAFWATVGGMGLTGTILTARFRLIPVESAYVTVDYQKTANLNQTLDAFSEGDERYPYSVAWVDCLARGDSLGRSVLMRGSHTPAAEVPEWRATTRWRSGRSGRGTCRSTSPGSR